MTLCVFKEFVDPHNKMQDSLVQLSKKENGFIDS